MVCKLSTDKGGCSPTSLIHTVVDGNSFGYEFKKHFPCLYSLPFCPSVCFFKQLSLQQRGKLFATSFGCLMLLLFFFGWREVDNSILSSIKENKFFYSIAFKYNELQTKIIC